MPSAPQAGHLRAVAFVDGQNLFHAARTAFGISHPSYDVKALASWVCRSQQWSLTETRFYTGIPKRSDDYAWNVFWSKKLLSMSHAGIKVWRSYVKYSWKDVDVPGHGTVKAPIGEEKGVDVRIALDIMRMAYEKSYDVAIIFSTDAVFAEAVDEVLALAAHQDRPIIVASAFPSTAVKYGIPKTLPIRIDEEIYQLCQDARDYR